MHRRVFSCGCGVFAVDLGNGSRACSAGADAPDSARHGRRTTSEEGVSAPAQVIVVNGTPYVVDCGDGVARQLVAAGVSLPSLRHVFITHHHSDHNADYGTLLLLAWAAGLRTRVDTWGPPPIEKMTRLFLEMNDYDITTRIADEGRVPLAPLLHAARGRERRRRPAGRARQGDGGARATSSGDAVVRVPLRHRRSVDRDFR